MLSNIFAIHKMNFNQLNNRIHTGDHFDTNAKIKSSSDCFCAIMARRVKKREKGNKLPWSSWTILTSLRYFLYGEKNLVLNRKYTQKLTYQIRKHS